MAFSLLNTLRSSWYSRGMTEFLAMLGMSMDAARHGHEKTFLRQWSIKYVDQQVSSPSFQDTQESWCWSQGKPRMIRLEGEEMTKNGISLKYTSLTWRVSGLVCRMMRPFQMGWLSMAIAHRGVSQGHLGR